MFERFLGWWRGQRVVFQMSSCVKSNYLVVRSAKAINVMREGPTKIRSDNVFRSQSIES